jgi:predicted GNAT family N-acyltransferase
MNNNLIRVKFSNQLPVDAKTIREEVFVKEQGFKDEFDTHDNIAYHAVLYYNNEAVATARTFVNEDVYVIGRVAVIKSMRNNRLGMKVILAIEEKIKQLGGTKVELSAQSRVQGFYKSLGYQTLGEEFLDEGCPHVKMIKSIKL